ncbi:hypothetical protein DSECCO2_372210 [anaerobic digester metagenome]
MAVHDEVDAGHRAGQDLRSRLRDAGQFALRIAEMGQGDDHVGLAAQLRDQLAGFVHGRAEGQALDMLRVADNGRGLGGQAEHGHRQAAQPEDVVGGKEALSRGVVDVGRQQREIHPPLLPAQHGQGVVELVVAHGHGVVAHGVHAADVRLGVQHVGFGHAGVDVPGIEQEHMAAPVRRLGPHPVDHGLARRQAVLALGALPETSVMVVGVQDRQGLGSSRSPVLQRGAAAQEQDGQGRDEPEQLVETHAIPPFT